MKTDFGNSLLALLAILSIVMILVVPPVLRLVFLRKRRGKDCCPLCGSPMERGVCPRCGPRGIIIDPIEDFCPTCGSRLVDGMCPHADALVDPFHCPVCHAILADGVCPNGCGELEICPSCGSELADGVCPNGCAIVRCPACNGILKTGACPKGCAPRALNLGWSGAAKPTMAPWKLEVVAPAGFAGEACELPFEVVIGRSASERKTTGAYVQLHFDDRRKSCVCPRRYVKLVCDSATAKVVVELLSRVGRAAVDGRTLSAPGDKAVLPEGGILDLLQTGYRLKLVRASVEASGLRGAVTTTTRPVNE